MKPIIRVLLIALVTTTAYADEAKTDTPKPTDTAKKTKLTENELQVMAHYHAVNSLEIDLGKTAKKQAGSQAVKSYGEMLVKDHGEADKKLKELAKAHKQTIPAEKTPTEAAKQEAAEMKKAVAALKKLKGADFDRRYLQMMVDGHDKEVANIDSKIADVQDTQLADMLRAMKPVLQKHADEARQLQKSGAQASMEHSH